MPIASYARSVLPVVCGTVAISLGSLHAQTPSDGPRPDSQVDIDEAVPTLSAETYAHWREYLRPSEGEARWLEIPWRGSFWEGVQDAQIEGKPVLLWAMNGHPMGCT